MSSSAEYMDLPFDEAIKFFRQKVNLPTRTWKDLWQGMHSRAFVVAGATKTALLSDLRSAADKGISQGTTLAGFRENFDKIVARHGWNYKGAKGWRTATIFNTNLSVAYATGHYEQMMDEDVLKARPFWRYIASSSKSPRKEHMQWYNLVLPADDPFWDKHVPPQGYGCKCGVMNHSAREVERLEKEESDGDYPIRTVAPPDEYYEYTDKATGQIHHIPKGIDPGWDYNPGAAAWGKRLSDDAMTTWKAQGAAKWERLTPGDWETNARPEMIPVDVTPTKKGPRLESVAAVQGALEKMFGGKENIYSFANAGFHYDVVVNAESIAAHMKEDLSRSVYLPFLPEAVTDPFEVWLNFERHKGTGQVVLRQRIIKAITSTHDRGLLVVFQSKNGWMESWTMMPSSGLKYMNKQRAGKLIWARK